MEVTIRIETQDSIINQKIKITDPNISINHFVNQLLDNLKKNGLYEIPKSLKDTDIPILYYLAKEDYDGMLFILYPENSNGDEMCIKDYDINSGDTLMINRSALIG